MQLLLISLLLSPFLVTATGNNDGASLRVVIDHEFCTLGYFQNAVNKTCLQFTQPGSCSNGLYTTLKDISKVNNVPLCQYESGVLQFYFL